MRLVVLLAVLAMSISACRPPGYGKGDDEPAVDAAPMQPDAPTDAPAATTCDKTFRLNNHGGASSVWLTGSFNSWAGDPGAGAVELMKDGDAWIVQKTMDAGEHQYKFIVDGTNWMTDPDNPNQADDGFGGKNSVYTCTPG